MLMKAACSHQARNCIGETDVSAHSSVGRITSFIKRALAQFLKGRMSGKVWCPSISEELYARVGFITNHFFLFFVKPVDLGLYPDHHGKRDLRKII